MIDPDEMDKHTAENIEKALEFAVLNKGKINDSVRLQFSMLVKNFYNSNKFMPVWSHKEKWEPMVDTIIGFIEGAEKFGLFPRDYQLKNIKLVKNELDGDSIKRMDAQNWTRADLLLTDGFMHIIKDIKKGRIGLDSTFLKKTNPPLTEDFYFSTLKAFVQKNNFSALVDSLEPPHKGYRELKMSLANFLDSMDRQVYTYVKYSGKFINSKDSLFFIKTIQKRLKESGCVINTDKLPDSLGLNTAIKKYQQQKNIKIDGKISTSLVKLMNNNDVELFKRIALTLDRYKQMPVTMPDRYIWVNLPSYYMQVFDHDSVALESKIICGKPDTRTPLLYSVISDMILYPTWTVPNSIIKKQYLPKLKSNPYYLSRIGLHLVDSKGETVDPGTVTWAKYTTGIPYKVMQGSGDDNALGIMKFNFSNPYSVYLHDTNQRYLFKNGSRALSHGCVRVQQWDKLAFYIARNDSMNLKAGDSLRYNTDSIKNWLALKEKRRIGVKNGIPLFIAYFSCEARNGKVHFFEDIYGEDKMLREKYFADK
ncbi:MAG: L,D-transpeptidase family protein [Ferruginibacter sp.]